jgi:DNA (cytosine-5)-methyltransferase 1
MKTQLNELALFAGAGGGILGGHLLGWRTVCAVEWDAYAASVLVARQNDGCLPPFPIWDDVQTFDGRPWRGRVDVVSGGFPCQDISCAGKGAGIEGDRSSMWKHMARIIGEVQPRYAFVENSPMLVGRGLAVVLSDLAEMGYDARWGIVGAHHVSAPHKRDRIWVMANSNVHEHRTHGESPRKASEVPRQHRQERCPWRTSGTSGDPEILANSNVSQRERMRCPSGSEQKYADSMPFSAWWGRDPAETLESPVGRVAHGVASRVDRLKAIGNGQVPAVAQLAWETLNT